VLCLKSYPIIWSFQSRGNDYFGRAVAISGDTVVVGAYGDDSKGAAYVYQEAEAAGGGVYLPIILRNSQ